MLINCIHLICNVVWSLKQNCFRCYLELSCVSYAACGLMNCFSPKYCRSSELRLFLRARGRSGGWLVHIRLGFKQKFVLFPQELRERVLRGKYRVPFYMSTDCEGILRKFLVLNPTKRCTLEVRKRNYTSKFKSYWVCVDLADIVICLTFFDSLFFLFSKSWKINGWMLGTKETSWSHMWSLWRIIMTPAV